MKTIQAAKNDRIGRWMPGMRHAVGFISASAPALDPVSLSNQKSDIDAAAKAAGVEIEDYLVDLSPYRPEEPWTPAIRELLVRARDGRLGAVVVDSVGRLGPDRDAAMIIAVMLAECGVRIVVAASDAIALAASPIVSSGSPRPSARARRIRADIAS